MKKTFVVLSAFLACILIWSCNQKGTETKSGTTSDTVAQQAPAAAKMVAANLDTLSGTTFISVDTANAMLSSYLNSVNYKVSDSCIKSVYFNADSLRAYLNDTSKGKIAYVRIMVAHNMSYIKAGGRNRYAGCNKNALTAIIVGMDANYNYIYNANQMVMDHACPCPTSCPTIGTGKNDMLPLPTAGH